ncbi:MAG: hypothetical protein Tsb002_31410 [Wenzhouxiangellaceae bacterium]
MNNLRQALVGKTITGVITRPGRDGLPELLVLALEDGSYMQFVMPEKKGPKRRVRRQQPMAQALAEDLAVNRDSPQLPLIHTACG